MRRDAPRFLLSIAAAAAVLLAVAAAVFPAAAAAVLPDAANARYKLKPGASGKLCLECHDGFRETLALPFVHTPVKAGDCTDCHDPHASKHGKLLAAEPAAICAGCHADVVPREARSTHAPVAQGACVSCHDPHGSTQKGNLRKGASALCADCHQGLAAAIQSAAHKHNPVEKGCLGCHDPHASTSAAALLRKPPPALCVGCHAPGQPTFAKKHLDYPVAAADCTSCHDPHGSPNPGILWASVHAPVTRGMCAQCHEAPGSPEPLRTRRSGSDLCRGCHPETMNALQTKDQVHWPAVDRKACGTCHSPHAARTAGLLRAPQDRLCGSCHADALARQHASKVKHPPIEQGACTTCHDPHASDATFLLAAADSFELCGTCHDWQSHSAHPIGPKATDQRNPNLIVDCSSCHRTHGTPNAHMAHFDPKQELCVQCHSSLSR